MKFKETYWGVDRGNVNETDLVRAVVDSAVFYESGVTEQIQLKLDKLTEIVGLLFVQLPDNIKRDIAEALSYTEDTSHV